MDPLLLNFVIRFKVYVKVIFGWGYIALMATSGLTITKFSITI